MKNFRIITLGCKVNQCESAALGHLLEKEGFDQSQSQTDLQVIVINTCAVTGKAAMQSRQAIRQAIRRNPGARIVVTGCYAQTAPEDLKAIHGINMIVGHSEKMRIVELLSSSECEDAFPALVHQPIVSDKDFAGLEAVSCSDRTRAFLKIQDGCNMRCTYCIVPYARGGSRSMPVNDVFDHMLQLRRTGFHEIVLTGIHLGAYGNDLFPKLGLTDLLVDLTNPPIVDRIRVSSIEPTEVDHRIIQLMADRSRGLCRHFHIPLQSGDDDILRRMGRHYTCNTFAEVIHDISGEVPGVAIGMDVIAGFPGEDEASFANTLHFIDALPIAYLHVFPFSPRKGTPAAKFKNRTPEAIIKQRCSRLRDLSELKRLQFHQSMVGQILNVLIENESQGFSQGLSDNYAQVLIPDAKKGALANCLVQVRIDDLTQDGKLIGSRMGDPKPTHRC